MTHACIFYIVRHGQTQWNVIHRIQGQLDSPLTQQGEEEALQTAKKLQAIHFDAIFSSDLLRAVKTAEILTLEKKLEIKTARALRERTFGKFDGYMGEAYDKEIQDLLAHYKTLSIQQQWKFKFEKGYESDEELFTRFSTFLREIAVAYPNKKVLIVTHGGNIRTFLSKLGFAPHNSLGPGTFKNAGYVVVQSDGTDFSLQQVEGMQKPI